MLSVSAAWPRPDGTHTLTGLYADAPVTYTLTNGSSGPLYDVAFKDSLSPGTRLEFYPVGSVSYESCGSGARSLESGAKTTVSISGVTIASGASCTITVDAIGTQAGTGRDSLSDIHYATTPGGATTTTGVTAAGDPGVEVLSNPAVGIFRPRSGGVYAYGRVIRASYSCRQGGIDFGGAISGCLGYDGLGHEIGSGDYLDTLVPGQRSLAVMGLNIGDGFAERVVNYTVASPTITALRSPSRAPLRYSIRLPVAGALQTLALDGRRVVARLNTAVRGAGTVRPEVRLNATGRRMLTSLRRRAWQAARRTARRHHRKPPKHIRAPALRVTLRVTYTPSVASVVASPYFTPFSGRTVTASRAGVSFR